MEAIYQEGFSLPRSAVLGILAVDLPILVYTARKRPHIPLMMIFAFAPFQYDMSIGGPLRFSVAEINLMVTCAIFFLRRQRIRWGPTFAPTLSYLGVCALSALITWRTPAPLCIVQIALYLVFAVMIFASFARTEEDYRPALYGLIAIGFVLAMMVIVTRSGYVLGLHKNGVGGSLAAAVIVCGELWFAERKRKRRTYLLIIMGVLAAGLFFSLSRGSWMGACAGLTVILLMRRQFRIMMRLGIVVIPLVVVCWSLLPEQDRAYTTGLSGDNWNIKLRMNSISYAKTWFSESPIIGMGVGLRKIYDATNVFWLTLAETGVLGFLTFFGLHGVYLRMVWKTQARLARDELLYSLVAIGAALVCSKLVHGMVDHYWSRGPIMTAWAAAGMATFAYFKVRSRRRLAGDGRSRGSWLVPQIAQNASAQVK
jgi:O-antigen ligase